MHIPGGGKGLNLAGLHGEATFCTHNYVKKRASSAWRDAVHVRCGPIGSQWAMLVDLLSAHFVIIDTAFAVHVAEGLHPSHVALSFIRVSERIFLRKELCARVRPAVRDRHHVESVIVAGSFAFLTVAASPCLCDSGTVTLATAAQLLSSLQPHPLAACRGSALPPAMQSISCSSPSSPAAPSFSTRATCRG